MVRFLAGGISSKRNLILQALLGIVILVLLFWQVGWQDFLDALVNIELSLFILALVFYAIDNLVLAFRYNYVLKYMGIQVPFAQVFLCHLGGMLYSDVTPGRVGYFTVPYFLKKRANVAYSSSLSAIIGLQSLEFFIKVFGCGIGLIYIGFNIENQILFVILLIGTIFLLIVAVILGVIVWSEKAEGVVQWLCKIPVIGKILAKLLPKFSDFQQQGQKIKPVIPHAIVLTSVSWLLKGLQWYLIALSLNITDISYFGFVMIHPLLTALSFVPITPAGLGLQESGIVIIFTLVFGQEAASSSAFSILARFYAILVDLAGILVFI